MDEMDMIQEVVLARQDAAMHSLRERARRERETAPVASRPCAECGYDIPQARLAARPGARLCVDCQSEAERPPR